MADGGNPLAQLIKKIQGKTITGYEQLCITDNVKKAEGEPAESIVDFKEGRLVRLQTMLYLDTEGSGEEHVEGSGEAAVNETVFYPSDDYKTISECWREPGPRRELRLDRPGSQSAAHCQRRRGRRSKRSVVFPSNITELEVTSTTFSPPVSIPQLHSDPPSVNGRDTIIRIKRLSSHERPQPADDFQPRQPGRCP